MGLRNATTRTVMSHPFRKLFARRRRRVHVARFVAIFSSVGIFGVEATNMFANDAIPNLARYSAIAVAVCAAAVYAVLDQFGRRCPACGGLLEGAWFASRRPDCPHCDISLRAPSATDDGAVEKRSEDGESTRVDPMLEYQYMRAYQRQLRRPTIAIAGFISAVLVTAVVGYLDNEELLEIPSVLFDVLLAVAGVLLLSIPVVERLSRRCPACETELGPAWRESGRPRCPECHAHLRGFVDR